MTKSALAARWIDCAGLGSSRRCPAIQVRPPRDAKACRTAAARPAVARHARPSLARRPGLLLVRLGPDVRIPPPAPSIATGHLPSYDFHGARRGAVHSITFSRWLPPQETGSSSLPSRRPPASRCQAQPASQAGARHRPSASACQSQCGRAAALGGGQGAPPSVPKRRAVACLASAGGAREDWMLLRWCVGLGPHPADPL